MDGKPYSVAGKVNNRIFSIAPMMDWTDRHCRFFLRLFSRHTLLYTEMVTTGAIIHGDRKKLLEYHSAEHPLALQLGGSDPGEIETCARIAMDYGYDEVNLNVGCPSDRVQSGRFGACLMAEPDTVARCVEAMRKASQLPVTVKTRIGIDDRDSYEELYSFVSTVASAGCGVFIIHARKAWLQGLSPKENREKPPLRYDVAARLKDDFPGLKVVLNGGITSLEQAEKHLQVFDGVMVGREAYQNPCMLAGVNRRLFGETQQSPTRIEIMERFLPYVESQLEQDVPLWRITRHILGLFQGVRGARAWRRHISENAHRSGAGLEVLSQALRMVDGEGPLQAAPRG